MIEKTQEDPTNQINSTPIVPAEKKIKPLTTIIILTVVLLIGAGGYLLVKVLNQPKFCSTEAKICPGGSTVGRTGPNCEFAPCPTQVPSAAKITDETLNWKTYTNEKYGFEFKYPEFWQ